MKITLQFVQRLWEKRIHEKTRSFNTRKNKLLNLRIFFRFLNSYFREIEDLRDFNSLDATNFISWLRTEGKEISTAEVKCGYDDLTVSLIKSSINEIFKLLIQKKKLLTNPFSEIEINTVQEKYRIKLSIDEMETFLESIIPSSKRGIRDRALFELIYSSALRPNEPGKLKIEDVDISNRLLIVRGTKVGKDNCIPFTQRASEFLIQQIEGRGPSEYVFELNGRGIQTFSVNRLFHIYSKACGVYRAGLSAYSIRHSTATHLLEKGADIRYVQKLLNHESSETTTIYTQQSAENLKKIYKSFHPRENFLFREVDEEYLERWTKLKIDLESQWEWRIYQRNRRLRIKSSKE